MDVIGNYLIGSNLQINLITLLSGIGILISIFALYRARFLAIKIEKEIELIRMELTSINNGSLGMGKRLIEVEKKLQGNIVKQEETEMGHSPYNMATALFGRGSDITEVIKACGISRPEAELMQLMHRQMKRYGPAPK